MKRNPKPFAVEIKKARTERTRHLLPPKHLFAALPDDTTQHTQNDPPHAVTEPVAAPGILPSILSSAASNSEPPSSEPHKRASRSKANSSQIAFDLHAGTACTGKETDPDLLAASEGSQTASAATGEEGISPVSAVLLEEGHQNKTKMRTRRRRAPGFEEPVETAQFVAAPMSAEPDGVGSLPRTETSPKDRRSRLTKRQAAAVQLPRNERWKRRLHPAAW